MTHLTQWAITVAICVGIAAVPVYMDGPSSVETAQLVQDEIDATAAVLVEKEER